MRTSLVLAALALPLLATGCIDTRRVTNRDSGVPPRDSGGCALTDCGGLCIDILSDPSHCGGCFAPCEPGLACLGGTCGECTPSCEGLSCGDDGCGGSCGTCPAGTECIEGACESGCTPSCADAECGDDGCGGSCGTCPFGTVCEGGFCSETCTPNCEGVECGSDGCGGSCGTCPSGTLCSDGFCESTCTPSCSGRVCGTDGCGGSCGTCPTGSTCSASGTCMSTCTPSCTGRMCGTDGCDGSCGTCPTGSTCSASGTCSSVPGGGESCSSATSIASTGGSYSFSFTGRTANHTPLSCSTTSGQPDVAFRVTAARSGTATFETSGSIDTVMAVYSSSTCSTSLACDDDGASVGTNSLITLTVTAGTTYYIVIAPYGTTTPTGTSTLMVTMP